MKMLQNIIEQFKLTELQDEYLAIQNQQIAKIVFVGEFSAGKSTLVNAILGTKLPVTLNPTTKSICIIEPQEGLVENHYYTRDAHGDTQIKFHEFKRGILEKNPDTAYIVKTTPSSILPLGCHIVDTPGLESLGGEAELTLAYLQYADAIIVCINANDGTIKQSLTEFLLKDEMKSLAQRTFFVITHADEKDNMNDIKAQIKTDIFHLHNDGYEITNLDAKILASSVVNGENKIDDVTKMLHSFVLDDLSKIHNERRSKEFDILKNRIVLVLKRQLSMMNFSTSEFDEERLQYEKEIYSFEKDIKKYEDKFVQLKDRLKDNISPIIDGYFRKYASSEDRSWIVNMFEEILAICSEIIKKSLKDSNISLETNKYSHSIEITIDEANNTMNRWTSGGEFLENAVLIAATFATAGVAAPAAAAGVSRKVIQQGAKESIKLAVTKTTILKGLATVINALSPTQWVKSIFFPDYVQKRLQERVSCLTNSIASDLTDSIKHDYHDQYIKPIKNILKESLQGVHNVQDKRKSSHQEFVSYKAEIEKAIHSLTK